MDRVEVWGIYRGQGQPITFVAGPRPDGPNIQSWGGIEHIGHYEIVTDPNGWTPPHWDFFRDNYHPICGIPVIYWQRDNCPGGATEFFNGVGF